MCSRAASPRGGVRGQRVSDSESRFSICMMEPTLAKASMRDFLARRLLVLADAEMAEITRGVLLCGHV